VVAADVKERCPGQMDNVKGENGAGNDVKHKCSSFGWFYQGGNWYTWVRADAGGGVPSKKRKRGAAIIAGPFRMCQTESALSTDKNLQNYRV